MIFLFVGLSFISFPNHLNDRTSLSSPSVALFPFLLAKGKTQVSYECFPMRPIINISSSEEEVDPSDTARA